MKERRIAFIGPKEYAQAMRFMGFICFGVLDEKEAEEEIIRLIDEDYALIFVAQDVSSDKIRSERVVVVPGIAKKEDKDFLSEEITKAVGGEIEL